MPISFVASASNSYMSALQVVINKPSGTTSNDVMVAVLCHHYSSGGNVWNTPTGWTLMAGAGISDSRSMAVFYKVAGGSEPASYTFEASSLANNGGGVISSYRGVDPATPINTQNAGINWSGTAPSISTSVANAWLIFCAASRSAGGGPYWTPPPGMNERADVNAATLADEVRAGGGATGTRYTSTADSDGTVSTYMLALTPKPNTAPGTPTITYPNGNEKLNSNHTITWAAATDADGDSLQYHIQISTNNGGVWSDIVALTGAGAISYAYNFSNLPNSDQCLIRIRAWDGQAYGLFDQSNATFTINHQTNQMVI